MWAEGDGMERDGVNTWGRARAVFCGPDVASVLTVHFAATLNLLSSLSAVINCLIDMPECFFFLYSRKPVWTTFRALSTQIKSIYTHDSTWSKATSLQQHTNIAPAFFGQQAGSLNLCSLLTINPDSLSALSVSKHTSTYSATDLNQMSLLEGSDY